MNSNIIFGVICVAIILLVITLCITIPILIYILYEKGKREKPIIEQIQKPVCETRIPYYKANLLTNNEMRFYRKLKEITNPSGYGILTKIRLADLVNVDKSLNNSEYYSYFGKIKSKHVDFAVHWDMDIVCLIELDDYSHQRADRAERDRFVDDVLARCGYTVIHTYGETEQIYNAICQYATKKATV